MTVKVYLAGPDVFLPDALDRAQKQRELCAAYGFEPLHPLDNDVDIKDKRAAMYKIYGGNIAQIKRCHVVVANCNLFRGGCMDDGTAYELGYAHALGKSTYGYIDRLMALKERVPLYYPCREHAQGRVIDKDGFLVEDFGGSINLMMQCGIYNTGGALLEGDLEACLKVMREDVAEGILRS